MKELSKEAQDIILNSWSKGTTNSYNVYLKQWFQYCEERNIIPKEMSIREGIEFLTYMFNEKKLGYSAINTARSALSLFIGTNNNMSFGKQDIVTKLLKGMFRLRPSLPKYTVMYDPEVVLNYLRTITDMTLKSLTLKLTTLLCFLTGQRNQTINSIDITHMHEEDDRIIFYIPDVLKTTTRSSHLDPLVLQAYHEEALCVVTHIKLYMDVTKSVRNSNTKLLLSYVAPHEPVSTATTARWIKESLKNAGINTQTFTAHSTRSASTSLAKTKGLAVSEIRKAAGWKPGSTFARFYDRPIMGKNFGDTILS